MGHAKILVTYFEQFEGRAKNCSGLVAGELMVDPDLEGQVDYLELPVVFADSWPLLQNKLKSNNFSMVMSLGEAPPREKICLETTALNLMNARIPDNKGAQPKEQKIDSNGPDTLNVTWSVQESYDKHCQELPIALSENAGEFVCNYIMYKLLQHSQNSNTKAGFIHLPLCMEQGEQKDMPPPQYEAEELAESVKTILMDLL